MKKFFVIAISLFLLSCPSFAQTSNPTTDEQLAAQYYQAGEYDKAVVYYEKLYSRTPIEVYYNYYLNCLIYTKDLKKAEKIVKKNSEIGRAHV